MKNYDCLIVGAGLFGATLAHRMRCAGKSCMVLDKRTHLGGNVFCRLTEGINVHQYGAHIFHTSNRKVWDFVNGLVPFNRYTNSPVANFHGRLYNLPFNMNTFYEIFGVRTPQEAQRVLDKERQETADLLRAQGIGEPRNLEEQAQLLIGRTIYRTLVKEYTEKQWGRPCTELPAFIIRRLPVRLTFDNNYFDDTFQGIPVGGYNRLTEGLLEGADTRTCEDYLVCRDRYNRTQADRTGAEGTLTGEAGARKDAETGAQADRMGTEETLSPSLADRRVILSTGEEIGYTYLIYTGALDAFFDYRLGKLEYRTVRFETETLDMANFQGNAVVNYTSHDEPFTRIIEHKHFERFGQAVYDLPRTVISREYSTEWKPGMEPYYPVNDARNNALFAQYKAAAERLTRSCPDSPIRFGGRLADYKYYDMSPVIERAWLLADSLLRGDQPR